MTVQTALQQGSRLLDDGAVAAPRLTAEVLLCRVLGCERPYLYSHPEHELSEPARLRYGRYLHERLEGKPTQYITKRQEFYGREFHVTPDVLIPRPETEHLVEAVTGLWKGSGRIVDVGCGSGAIAVSLSLELGAETWATDISQAALAVAAENSRRLGARVRFAACDLLSAFAPASLDLVACNPPYVSLRDREGLQREVRDFEPEAALFAGETGLEVYERIIADAERTLKPDGAMALELGFTCAEPVREMLGPGWAAIQILPDLAGIPRVLSARRTP